MITIGADVISKVLDYNYGQATNKIETTLERLVSGFKVNSSADSPALYTISEGLNKEILDKNAAMENAQTGVNFTKLAKDNVTLIQNLLKEIKVLTEAASSSDLTSTERSQLQDEVDERLEKIKTLQSSGEINDLSVLGSPVKMMNTVDRITEAQATAAGYTVVKTESELQTALNSNKKIILMNDISLSSSYATVASYSNELNGNGYAIKNGTKTLINTLASGATVENIALEDFKTSGSTLATQTSGSVTIGNVAVIDVEILATSSCGALVGIINSSGAIVKASYSTGNIQATSQTKLGGLVGVNNGGTITGCYSTVDIQSISGIGGGLVGLISSGGCVFKSYATGDLNFTSGDIGGLVGMIDSSSRISKSFSTGGVTLTETGSIGGLVGSVANSTISDSYSTGDVNATVVDPASTYAGGFIGLCYDAHAHMQDSYSTGKVTSNGSLVGGIIGKSSGLTLAKIYYDSQKNAGMNAVGDNASATGVTGLTTSQTLNMTAASTGFSTSIWNFNAGQNSPTLINTENLVGISLKTNSFNVYVGDDSSASSMTSFDSGYSIGSLTIDLSSQHSSIIAAKNTAKILDFTGFKINEMAFENEKYTNIVSLKVNDIQELSDSVKALIGADSDEEQENLTNAQSLQSTCQYLLSQTASLNASVVLSLLPKKLSSN